MVRISEHGDKQVLKFALQTFGPRLTHIDDVERAFLVTNDCTACREINKTPGSGVKRGLNNLVKRLLTFEVA